MSQTGDWSGEKVSTSLESPGGALDWQRTLAEQVNVPLLKSARVHEHMYQTQGSLGLGERGGVRRETGTFPQDAGEPAPNCALKFALLWEGESQRVSSPRACTNKSASHQTRIRIRSSAGGTAEEMGFVSRHWAHRDQTWTGWGGRCGGAPCVVFTRAAGREFASVTHQTRRVL